jgi:hypothetical protein
VTHDEADVVVGSIATDSAIGFDPLPLLEALSRNDARVVIMGQVAGILHGSRELTGDLDLLWDGDPAQADRMAAAFASVDAQLTDADSQPVHCDTEAFALPKVFFHTRQASGDCCTPALPWGALDIAGIIERADVLFGSVRYVSLEDLIVMRRAVGRPKDLRRVDELEAR